MKLELQEVARSIDISFKSFEDEATGVPLKGCSKVSCSCELHVPHTLGFDPETNVDVKHR